MVFQGLLAILDVRIGTAFLKVLLPHHTDKMHRDKMVSCQTGLKSEKNKNYKMLILIIKKEKKEKVILVLFNSWHYLVSVF